VAKPQHWEELQGSVQYGLMDGSLSTGRRIHEKFKSQTRSSISPSCHRSQRKRRRSAAHWRWAPVPTAIRRCRPPSPSGSLAGSCSSSSRPRILTASFDRTAAVGPRRHGLDAPSQQLAEPPLAADIGRGRPMGVTALLSSLIEKSAQQVCNQRRLCWRSAGPALSDWTSGGPG